MHPVCNVNESLLEEGLKIEMSNGVISPKLYSKKRLKAAGVIGNIISAGYHLRQKG